MNDGETNYIKCENRGLNNFHGNEKKREREREKFV